MAYWLVKTEPDDWSWDDQVKAAPRASRGPACAIITAKQNLMKMKKGDRAFFYHSGDEQADRRHRRGDPRALSRSDRRDGRVLVAVDVKAVEPLPQAGDARRDQGRAEAQGHGAGQVLAPVGAAGDAPEWKLICNMGGVKG